MSISQLETIQFHNQSLIVLNHENKPYIAMKPVCENIGLDWHAQLNRINRHNVLNKGVVMIATPTKGGIQKLACLPISMINGWLFGIDTNRAKPEIRQKLEQYQSECFDVLYNHFMQKEKTLPPTQPIPVEPTDVKIETVKFYDQEIDVIFHENLPYIIVKQISDNIGINYTTARDRIQKRNDINHSVKLIKLPTNGGMQRYLCLPLAMLNVWLQKLVPSRTAAGDMLIRYQRECFNFLFSHFAQNGYKQITPVMTNRPIETEYEKLTAAQMRELAQKIHEISNQFHFSRTANNAIWFAIRYVTGTPSPLDFDVRHLPLIINECNRINAILSKYTHVTKQNERLIIAHAIRKRESIDDILDATEREIKFIENLTDNELLKSVKPCYNLATIDIVGQK